MDIYYQVKYNESADPGDANIIRKTSDKNIKFITIKNVLETSLNQKYKFDKDIVLKMEEFLNDFSKSEKIQMLYLDTTGKEIKNCERILQTKNKHTYKNLVFLAKNKCWGNDSAAIFTDLIFKKIQDSFIYYFEIKRIEFLELDNFYSDTYKIVNIQDITFIECQKDNEEKISAILQAPLLSRLINLKKINNIFDGNDIDVNKFNVWFNFIRNLKSFIDEIQKNEKHYLFPLDKLDYDDIFNEQKKVIITKNISLNEAQLNFLTSSYDENISCKIKCFLTNSKPDNTKFIDLIDEKIIKIQNKIDENDKKIKDLNENNLSLSSKKENLENDKNNLENEKFEISNNILLEDDEKKLQVKNIEEKLKSKNKEINYLQNEKELNNSRIKSFENENKEFKKHEKELKEFISSFCENKINAFFVKLTNNDENKTNNKEYYSTEPNFNLNKILNDQSNLLYISEDYVGLYVKIKRYKAALENAAKGYYKNPYLLYSIQNVPKLKKILQMPEEIKIKYKLNEKQLDSVNGALSSQDTYYLQGPPGTGKTQTICAISESHILKNKNILMTSSTHEAISNFLDRLSKNNTDNPNIIIFKYSYNENSDNEFSEDNLYKNFIKKIHNHIKKTNSNLQLLEIKALLDKVDSNILNYFDFDNNFYINENILNNIIDKSNLNALEQKLLDYLFSNFNQVATNKQELRDCKNIIIKKINNSLKEVISIKNEQIEIIDNIYKKLNKEYLSFNEIKNLLTQKNKNIFIDKLDSYSNKKSNTTNLDSEYKNKFLKYISNHHLINVIGITTTARTNFSILETTYDLFIDYPIDIVIIDEISKSSTPEILARAILSKKVIFCGDYNQLPPTSDINEEFINKLSLDNDYQKYNDFYETFEIENYDNKLLFTRIKELYENSFFYNQVDKLKNIHGYNSKNTLYCFLKKQHRFCKPIMDLVNINYDTNEQLEMGFSDEHFNNNQYSFKIGNLDLKGYETILIDSSKISNQYKDELSRKINFKNYCDSLNSFDQYEPIFSNIKTKSTGVFNEYNAYICEKICNSLVSNNEENIINKIGIICLTRNQKNLIKNIIKNNPLLNNKKIKIDTIDNFQGQERDIILVDFVRAKNSYKNSKFRIEDGKKNLDFISNRKRNNVALSRAKNKLILIGAFEYYMDRINRGTEIYNLTGQYKEKSKHIEKWWEYEN